jgi:hypothetical protein
VIKLLENLVEDKK